MKKRGIFRKLIALLMIFAILSGVVPVWNFGIGKVYAEGEQVITNFEGDLTTEQVFSRPFTPADREEEDSSYMAIYTTPTLTAGNKICNYFIKKFEPSVTGKYTIEVTNAVLKASGDDTFLLLYGGGFNPANPLANILACNDDKNNIDGDEENKIYSSWLPDQNLTAGTEYYIVMTSFFTNDTGHVSFSITGPGSVSVSDPATAAVPAIETQPQDVIISEGNILILNVKASASDGGTLSYQWQKSVDSGSTWGNIAGATGSTYITGALAAGDSGTSFRCVVTNTKGGSAASATTNAVSVTVNVSDTPDTAAPTFAEGPAADADAVYITLTASLNESGTIYYLAVPKDSAAPLSSEVIAGVPYGNIKPIASGSQPASDAPYSQTIYIKGLKEKTEYDVYVVAADDENSPNVMAVPVKLSTKTTENNALQFDEDSTVTGLSGISPAEFTLEFKLNTCVNSSGMKQDIYRGKDSDGHDVAICLTYFIIEMNGDGSCIYAPQLSISVEDNSYTAGAVLSSYNGWLHVAITSSQTSGTALYINGKSYVQLDDPIKLPVSGVHMGTDFVFEDHEYPTFNIDDFQIWDKEKTADEIKADMNSELLPPFSQHLVRYYNFNRGIGLGDNTNPPVNTLPDKLGNGIGTLANFDLIGYLSNWIKIILNSTVNPTSVTFDKNTANTSEGHYQDEVLTLTLNGNTLYDVKLNGASIVNGNYTLSGNTLTLKKEYLSTLTTGTKIFTVDMSEGFDPKVTVTVIDTSAPVKAPGFSPEPDPGPGTEPGTTGIPGVTPGTGNHLLVKVSSSIIATPNTGDAAPTGSGVIDPYTAGSDIPGVDAVVNKYIGLYEADSSNKVVKFKLIVLGAEDINPGPAAPVPGFSPEPDPGPGTEPGTTGVPGVTPVTGNHLLVKVSSSIIATPNTGDAAPTGSGVIDPYTAGSDIPGVDAVVNKYIGLYEADSSNKVVKFKLIVLGTDDINPWPTNPVPGFSPEPDPRPGTVPGTTAIPDVTTGSGIRLLVKVSSDVIATPTIGDTAPTGAGVIDPYTAGSDIPGVDAVVNKYIGLYEVDDNNRVVKFLLITLTYEDINSAMPVNVPGIPTGVTAVAGNGQATVSFTAPEDNGGSPITGYIVTSSPGNITATGTGTTITVYGLTNGTTYTFTVKAVNAVGNSAESAASNAVTPYSPSSGGSSGGGSGGGSAPSTPTTVTGPTKPAETGVEILVNGRVEIAATAKTTKEGEKNVLTITVDDKKVAEKLEREGKNTVVTIPVKTEADVIIGKINGQTVKNMENKEAVLEIKTNNIVYSIPASQINIDAVSGQIGREVQLKDISIEVRIAASSKDTVKLVEEAAAKNDYQLVVNPVDFEITCTNNSKTVEVSRFNVFVNRMMAIPEGIDPNKITTGVVVEPDGASRHVPTKVTLENGRYYAVINSLTNSTYTVVWHPLQFKDVEKHWAKDAINDMGSRMVVNGTGEDRFNPDRDITRAEFAAIIVKALGLKPGMDTNQFTDVKNTDWYADYIRTASDYNLISGYSNGKFGPMDKITREQAMSIIARAMKITGLKVELKDGEIQKLLEAFGDSGKAAQYAKSAIAACLKAEIVSGRNGKVIAPKENITRAEVAAVVRRLLQKSELI